MRTVFDRKPVRMNYWVVLIVVWAILTVAAIFLNGCGTVNGLAHDVSWTAKQVEQNTESSR